MTETKTRVRCASRIGFCLADMTVRLFSFLFIILGALKLLAVIFPNTVEVDEFLKFNNAIVPFIPNRYALTLAAITELFVGYFGLQRKNPLMIRSILLLWFSGVLLAYHIGLILIRYRGPCGCLLGINRIIPIRVGTQNSLAQIIMIATLIVSGIITIYARRTKSMSYLNPGVTSIDKPIHPDG
jgi:hypothetical protein